MIFGDRVTRRITLVAAGTNDDRPELDPTARSIVGNTLKTGRKGCAVVRLLAKLSGTDRQDSSLRMMPDGIPNSGREAKDVSRHAHSSRPNTGVKLRSSNILGFVSFNSLFDPAVLPRIL
jgi:hypothetical protein